jgi:hypothetical protein
VHEKGSLAEEMRALFWRDFALLPVDERNGIGDLVWEFIGQTSGPYSVVAALMD